MNCARCGAQLQPGANRCSVCGEAAGAPGVYQQSYVQYQQGAYPPGYQPPYAYGQGRHDEGGFLGALSDLPHAFVESFTHPGDVMRTMVERRDRFSWMIVSALVLLLSFLCGMVLMRGFLGILLRAISVLSGTPLASTDASMSQGVSYIAGRVAPMAGGIAVLCQLIAIAVPLVVVLVYRCLVRKVPFSWHVALGMAAVTTMPTVAFALLSMLLSFVSPWLCLLVIIAGIVVAYLQLSNMMNTIVGGTDAQLLPAKMICFPIAILLTLAVLWFVGGNLMGNVFQHMLSLLGNTGSFV